MSHTERSLRNDRRRGVLGPLFLAAGLLPGLASAAILSDNISNVSSGTESASGNRRLAASFGTDVSTYTLNSVTLLLANPLSGSAQVDIYSDQGLEPGTLVGALTSPGSYSGTLAATTFTTPGIALNPSTTYWVVFRVVSGQFEWSWSTNDSGSGVGFKHTWNVSEDAGSSWYGDDRYQTQMTVTATGPCTVQTWYRDFDSDGYGSAVNTTTSCTQPGGYVSNNTDCDDSDPARFPGNPEICDGKDNNCNLIVDDVAAPSAIPRLVFDNVQGTTASWTAVSGATGYDIVVGDLEELRASGGNYATQTGASCFSNDHPSTSIGTGTLTASPGHTKWLAVRPVNCGGAGSYDEGDANQDGSRDPEIQAGGYGCP